MAEDNEGDADNDVVMSDSSSPALKLEPLLVGDDTEEGRRLNEHVTAIYHGNFDHFNLRQACMSEKFVGSLCNAIDVCDCEALYELDMYEGRYGDAGE